jgi:uncharacterized protein YdbL (DUF1318 family)
MRRIVVAVLALCAAAVAVPAAAQQSAGAIVAARQAGQVGERFDGYLGYVSVPSPALRRQVDTTNIRRRALYTNLASRRGVLPQDVGVTAACLLLGNVAVGEFYLLSDGRWRRRMPGQRAQLPGHCG